jgi:hypothetical protein
LLVIPAHVLLQRRDPKLVAPVFLRHLQFEFDVRRFTGLQIAWIEARTIDNHRAGLGIEEVVA